MSPTLQHQLQSLSSPEAVALLKATRRGIEKESLRITPTGRLAQTPHPGGLGSALSHSAITTDFSESLLEFITPVSTSIESSLETLENIHRYVYSQLGEELLWAASMPCVVSGDESIPIAEYGSSNVARMKTIYRHGLGHRYGRLMQTISGIHYNFSMPEQYWQLAWQQAGRPGTLVDYTSSRYLGLIRNFRRYSWLLIYLFGASPAVCSTFLNGRDDHGLEPFDSSGHSLHLPYSTSLRMGDLGYNSSAQSGLNICYNSLDNYIVTLRQAIMQPHPPYLEFRCGPGKDSQQLNDSLLQIENEFYSPVRPKRVARSGEAPLRALRRGGIEYVEVRCLDVNPFTAVGLDAAQIRFLDTFLLYCLLEDSPPCDDSELAALAANKTAVVNRGRQPGLKIQRPNAEISLQSWAEQLLDAMEPVAKLLDSAHGGEDYSAGLVIEASKVADPDLTPSARVLREMAEKQQSFFHLAMGYSERWAEQFLREGLPPSTQKSFENQALQSLADQRELEQKDALDFDTYLANFYAQYRTL